MKKSLFVTLTCVSIIASMLFATGASAIGTLEAPAGSDNWGLSLQQYSDRSLVYLQNWGNAHQVWIARGRDGDCLRLKEVDGNSNWVYVGTTSYPGNVLTAGTTYTLSVDYAPGPRGYHWPSVGLTISVGGQTITFSQMDNPYAKEWKTFSQDFTATGQASPIMKLTTDDADIYLDNLVIKEKSTGTVVFNQNFERLKTEGTHGGWGFRPTWYAETNAVPFYGLPANGSVGVIEREGNGYAAYIRNTTGGTVDWRFSNMEKKVRALPIGTYKVKYDYVYCDVSINTDEYLADRMSWRRANTYANVNDGWKECEYTFTSASNTQCGFQILSGCKMCVDNLRVEDLDGNVLVIEDFNKVPLWGGSNQFVVEPAVLSQSSNTVNVSAKVTNSFTDAKPLYLITAIYSSDGRFEDADFTGTEVVGDPRGINHTTSVQSSVDVSGLQGKTLKAFLWDGLSTVKPLAASSKITIE